MPLITAAMSLTSDDGTDPGSPPASSLYYPSQYECPVFARALPAAHQLLPGTVHKLVLFTTSFSSSPYTLIKTAIYTPELSDSITHPLQITLLSI